VAQRSLGSQPTLQDIDRSMIIIRLTMTYQPATAL